MIIQTPETTVQTSGKMRTAGFNMKASAKGFRIISTTLYKDPILAIVREITCNGWDGHQMNKNVDTPIEVHLPNRLEPWFSVKDFGCGMSDDEIFGVYTTVFDSTKDDSNDVIGAMGLGSKTPFSYNNGQSFTVKSIKNGLKAVYSAYLDKGEPAITCMSEPAPTDEPDGVEVIVPVVESDFERFRQAAEQVMPFFRSPSVNVNTDMRKRDFTFGHCGTYFTEPARNRYRSADVYAVMGNVCYPLSSNHINDIHTVRAYFNNADMYINFPIGELDVSASREELHYDDRTIENINKRVESINNGFLESAQKWVDEQTFEHESDAFRAITGRFCSNVARKLHWQGNDIYAYETRLLAPFALQGSVVLMKPEHSNKDGVRRVTHVSRATEILDASRDFVENKIHIIHDDLKSGGVAIAKEQIRRSRKAYYYQHDDKCSTNKIIPFVTDRLRDTEYVIIKTSELKAQGVVPAKKTVQRAAPKPTISLYKYTIENGLETADVDRKFLREGTYVFANMFRDDIVTEFGSQSGSTVYQCYGMFQEAMRLKGIDVLYIARSTDYKFIDGNKNATNFFKLKFNKRDLRSKINWKAYTVDKKVNESRYSVNSLHDAWKCSGMREHFGFNEGRIDCSTIDRMKRHFPEVKDVANKETEKHFDKLLEIQKQPRYNLAFELIDSYTRRGVATDLLKLLRGKRNG